MRILKKNLLWLVVFWALLCLIGSAAALPPEPMEGTLPFYWIGGRVTDADGSPIPNRPVYFYLNDLATTISTTTDANGTYEVNTYDLYFYKSIPITLETQLYYVAVPQTPSSGLGTEETIYLPPETGFLDKNLVVIPGGGPGNGTISGTVTDNGGTPIDGASITATRISDGLIVTGSSGTSGNYSLSLPEGVYQLSCAAAGYSTGYNPAVALRSRQSLTVNFTLDAIPAGFAEIWGRVTDEAGNGLDAAEIQAGIYTNSTIDGGYYRLIVRANREYSVVASKVGYERGAPQLVRPADRASLRVDFRLSLRSGATFGSLQGEVVNISGRAPIFGAMVSDGHRLSYTDLFGRFTIDRVPAGARVVTSVAPGFIPSQESANVTAGAPTTVNFELVPLGANQAVIYGWAQNVHGIRLPGAGISAEVGARLFNTTTSAEAINRGWYQILIPSLTLTTRARVTASYINYQSATRETDLAPRDSQRLDFILHQWFPPLPLSISRVDFNRDGTEESIQVTWEAGVNAQIFILTGTGEGSYTDSPIWTQITTGSGLISPPPGTFQYTLGSGVLTHEGEVGGGSAEVYYKALPANASAPADLLPSAPAVGKVNVSVFRKFVGRPDESSDPTKYSGWNFISSPLIMPTLDQTVGKNFETGDQIWFWDNSSQRFFSPISFNATANTWGTGSDLQRGFGCLLYLSNPRTGEREKRVTFIGNVDLSSLDRPMVYLNNSEAAILGTNPGGWNKIGNPFPIALTMEGFTSSNQDQLWIWPNEQQHFLAPITFTGTWPADLRLYTGRCYGYMLRTNTDFRWQLNTR